MIERMKIGRREFIGIAGTLVLGTALAINSKGEASTQEGLSKEVVDRNIQELSPSPEKEEKIEIILTGDVMLGRTVMTESLDEVGDPAYPFRMVDETLSQADLVFVNLENPIVSDCERIYEGYELCALPEMVEGLEKAGVDIVTLANNHTRVYGQEGIDETEETLSGKGILSTGLGELITKEIKGVKFGFLGFDFNTKMPKESDYDLVRESKPKVDVLIVGVHWGNEYHSEPTGFQKEWGKKLVESGADVVSGHGPHCVIDKEYVNGKPVYYSLGNFVFDQMWSEETRSGLAIKLIFEGRELVEEVELPIYLSNWAQPEFVEK
jgi:poly-gamma-glutamate synthesis protein (capsule biosynthesis protein)